MVEPDVAVDPIEGGHALGARVLLENMNPVVHHVIVGVFLITAVIFVWAVVDLIRKGRARTTSLALTRMLAGLAPLLGVVAAADNIFGAGIRIANTNMGHPAVVWPVLAQAAFALWIGAVCGVIGVVLTAVLRIESAWRAGRRTF